MVWQRLNAKMFAGGPDVVRRGFSSRRVWAILGVAVVLWVVGGPLGRIVAVGLLPRLASEAPESRSWRWWEDLAVASALGVVVALLAHLVWAPSLVTDGATVASDTGEHFWLLHSLSNPGWEHWSINRYPLPALLARPFAWGGTPHDCWYRAAIVYTGVIGAGLYLWGRAVGRRSTGVAAVLLMGAFPDLILLCRTVTAYPEMVAVWTLGAATCAGAARFPSILTLAAAGVGTGAVFASDARGLILGLVLLGCGTGAAVLSGRWQARAARLVAFLLPVMASWVAYHYLPIHVRSLEEMVEASIEVSYTRVGRQPPPRVFVEGGYRWGKSGPADMMKTIRALAASRARLNPDIAHDPHQVSLVQRRVFPYLLSVGLLGLLGLLIGAGFPPRDRLTSPRAWWTWFDWRGKLGLIPVVGFIAIFVNVVTFEYSPRYAALATPALVTLTALGLVRLGGRRQRPWTAAVVALAVLYLVPGPLNVRAGWRTPVARSQELRACLDIAAGRSNAAPVGPAKICVDAQSRPLDRPVAWPYGRHPEGHNTRENNTDQ